MKNNNEKSRIILLSDLWGIEKSDWITYYRTALERYFEIIYYDSCELGNVDKSDYSEEKLHHQFVHGGIETATKNLLLKANDAKNILGFSVGGSIAWKAVLSGLKAENIFTLSSTRLRYETQKPSAIIELFFGEEDTHKPNTDWFQKMGISEIFYKNEGHELYKKKEIAEDICNRIIRQFKLDISEM